MRVNNKKIENERLKKMGKTETTDEDERKTSNYLDYSMKQAKGFQAYICCLLNLPTNVGDNGSLQKFVTALRDRKDTLQMPCLLPQKNRLGSTSIMHLAR